MPDEHGQCKVWSSKQSEAWDELVVADSWDVYVLIDHSETEPGSYATRAHTTKFAKNNAHKHYHDMSKNGAIVYTFIPTVDGFVAMISVLWNGETPFPGQKLHHPMQRDEEIQISGDAASWPALCCVWSSAATS